MSAPVRSRPRRYGRPRGTVAASVPVAPRHEDTVAAFHAGQLGTPTRDAQLAARIVVDRLLCGWCGQSRIPPRVCRCR